MSALTSLLRPVSVAALVAAVAIFLSACGDPEVRCRTSEDCDSEQLCVEGICQDASEFNIGEPNQDPNQDECQIGESACTPSLNTTSNVYFIRTLPGSPESQVILIRNSGTADLEIDQIQVDGEAYSISFPSSPQADPSSDTTSFSPTVLSPDGDPLYLRITFDPPGEGFFPGEVEIQSNDPSRSVHRITLHGNDARGCAQISHDEGLDFGTTSLNQRSSRAVTIENCSLAAPLQIFEIELIDADDAFTLSLGPLSDLDEEPYVLPLLDMTDFAVHYDPTDPGPHTATLRLFTNDHRHNEVFIPITGQAAAVDCPPVEIAASIDGTALDTSSMVTVEPLTQVDLQAVAVDDGPENLDYLWSLITRPFRAYAHFSPDPNSLETSIQFDVTGFFRVELVAVNSDGISTCEPALLDVHVAPDPDQEIFVQLIWNSILLPEPEPGEGNDMEIHYVHPSGTWGSEQWAVWADQPEQSWDGGLARMENTDWWGEYPELLSHTGPVSGQNYDLGVYYKHDFGLGPSEASVSVFFHGELVYDRRARRVDLEDDLWRVGIVAWSDTSPAFQEIDDVIRQHPLEPGPPPPFQD